MKTRIAIRVLSATLLLLTSAGAAQAGSVTLAWDPNTDGTTTGYKLYWGPQSGVYTASLDVGNATTRQITGLTDGAPYYFIVRAYNSARVESGPSVEVSRRVGIPVSSVGDFSGDFKSEIGVFRPSTGVWYLRGMSTSYTWGGAGDVPVAGDYDGDGKVDVAVFRRATGAWYIWRSGSQTGLTYTWGGGTDVPVVNDYDGDGKTDVAVFRPSTGIWYIWQSRTSTGISYTFGGGGDIAVPADYDGDGKADVAVFRPATGAWYILRSNTSTWLTYTWGGWGDVPVPSDYDGDGKADVGIFRPATGAWLIWKSSTQSARTLIFGGGTDTAVPGDSTAMEEAISQCSARLRVPGTLSGRATIRASAIRGVVQGTCPR